MCIRDSIKVEQEDITNMAKEATRAQFAQYGMMRDRKSVV